MAFPNPNISDIIATAIEFRTRDIADNVLGGTALFAFMNAKGRVQTVDGGSSIIEELSFAENPNATWYSGPDLLAVGAADVIGGASFPFAQCAVPVVINGLEQLQNSGREKILSLIDARLAVGEKTMANLLSTAAYSDGTGFGGKQMLGLSLFAPTSPTTGTVGGINRANFPFWRHTYTAPGAGTITAANINTYMTTMMAATTRNKDHPKLIVADNNMWTLYQAFLQERSRFTEPASATLGYQTVKFMDADVVLDGGIGGDCPASQMFFLNLDYLSLRPHKDRNMVP